MGESRATAKPLLHLRGKRNSQLRRLGSGGEGECGHSRIRYGGRASFAMIGGMSLGYPLAKNEGAPAVPGKDSRDFLSPDQPRLPRVLPRAPGISAPVRASRRRFMPCVESESGLCLFPRGLCLISRTWPHDSQIRGQLLLAWGTR